MERGPATQTEISERPVAGRERKNGFRTLFPWIAGTALLYMMVACLLLQMWRTYIPILDMEVDTHNAVNLLRHGVIPQFGSVASYLVVNAPGVTAGMVPGLIMFPKEPALAEHTDDLLLFALTLWGLFALVARRFGNATAFYSCAFYMLSNTGLYFADTMRPRAHPVFLIWMLYFMDQWVADKSPKAFAIAVFIYIAADFWLLEFLPALLLLVIPWFVYRPKLPRLALLIAFAAGLCLWSPYLIFESHHHFIDLRSLFARKCPLKDCDGLYRELLTNPKLETVDIKRVHDLYGGPRIDGKKSSHESDHPRPEYAWISNARLGMCYKSKNETTFENVKGFWLCPSTTGEWWFAATDGSRWFSARKGWDDFGPMPANRKKTFAWTLQVWRRRVASLPSLLLAPFPDCAGVWGKKILCATTICGVIWVSLSVLLTRLKIPSRFFSWVAVEEKSRICLTLCFIAGVGPWVMMMFLVPASDPDMERRFLWIWVALAAFTAMFLQHVFKKINPWLAHAVLIALILMTAWNNTIESRAACLIANHFHAAPVNEFNEIVDQIGNQAKAEGKTSVNLGYDIAFPKWVLFARHADGIRKVGLEFDLVLWLRHGITNTDNSCEGIRPDDDYRIVEYASKEDDRQSYFDLSHYPRMEVFFETPGFVVLRKPKG